MYSFVGSCAILFVINMIPGFHLRASEDDEIMGMDDAEVGEFAYDYVELSRDVVHALEDNDAPTSETELRDKNPYER